MQPEDATLEEADLDDLNSHRSEDPKGMRRMKTGKAGKKEGEQYLQNIMAANKKAPIDHSPHEVFVQLDELQGAGEDREWKETARWIKYEEDVEEGADRWGRPHVASLSFHSLLNLRRCLETGVVLMDLDEKDLPGVAYRVVEQVRKIISREKKVLEIMEKLFNRWWLKSSFIPTTRLPSWGRFCYAIDTSTIIHMAASTSERKDENTAATAACRWELSTVGIDN